MPKHSMPSLFRVGSALALVLVLAGCTKGGQFDPTELFNSDVFDSKKKIKGDREPLFPNGVPGTTTGVPEDLVKGYQPPPDQADANTAPAPAPEAAKPKPKPKPKLAVAPAKPAPTRISVGPKPVAGQQAPSQTDWPAPPPTGPAQQSQQSVWPAPPPTGPGQRTAQPSQAIWPNPPAPGTSSQ